MEYFGINFKVYMIAHLNRSIGMLHENLKVLEYAALTKKQLKPLNMTLNQCIAKSAKKNYDKLKAEKDYQIKSAIDASDNASILKNRLNFALTANSRDYKDKTSKSLKKIRPYDLLNKSFT